ncbi:hypothetical protein ACQP1P_38555 [Dactylosporangium sp. CA-052675]|uniref:hypothetical protein n=1 Tax=Dactylosporangium sp. CA-052675 TaxID=3239927 RepID=UPI003D90FC23
MGAKATGLEELSADMQRAVERAIPDGKKITGKGALNVKREAQRIIRAASHRGYLPHYPKSISYDVTARGAVISAEIGPKTERLQGGLGRLIELGSANNDPIPHLDPGLALEENTFYSYMENLGEKLLNGEYVDGPEVDPG